MRSSRAGRRRPATGSRSCAPPSTRSSGTFSLVPQVVDAVRAPVIAAGGIADRRGVAAAFALGRVRGPGRHGVPAHAAVGGDRSAPPGDRQRADTDTVLTRAMSGRLARGIPNRAMREIETTGLIAPFPAQNWLTGSSALRPPKRIDGDLLSLWAGQSSPLATHEDAADVFAELRAGVPR